MRGVVTTLPDLDRITQTWLQSATDGGMGGTGTGGAEEGEVRHGVKKPTATKDWQSGRGATRQRRIDVDRAATGEEASETGRIATQRHSDRVDSFL